MDRLQEQYALRFLGKDHYRNEVWKILCADFFSRYVEPSDTILDLGAGWCEFINNIQAGRKIAIDLNPEVTLRSAPNVRTINQDCTAEWPIEPDSLDVVFSSNFLEHLPTKAAVEGAIAQAHRCLKPGGTMICLGPNIKFAKEYWDAWDHFVAFSEASMSEVLSLNGFSVETCIDRFLPFAMSRKRNPPLALVGLYLRLPFAWRFFGKQFLVIARKA